MDVFSTEVGIRLNFAKNAEFRLGGWGGLTPQTTARYATGCGEDYVYADLRTGNNG
jgi:hypothetical protein